ncbi:MAG: hypothetical protein JO072_12765 [Parafilimonas sp.]|nr:hypothetical protein [Parafilimonas sp.]
MKKQIIGCFAILSISATVSIASTAHSVNKNSSKLVVINDTTPPMHNNRSDSNWNKNKSKNKMHGDSTHHMNDTTHMMRDSTKL